jgi:hypothetical protein
MRKIIFPVLLVLAGLLVAQAAEAAVSGPSQLPIASRATGPLESVAYVCHRVWRCGPYGCGWRRACYRTGPRYYRRDGWPTWNGCPPGYTVQDGVCKPYRGY